MTKVCKQKTIIFENRLLHTDHWPNKVRLLCGTKRIPNISTQQIKALRLHHCKTNSNLPQQSKITYFLHNLKTSPNLQLYSCRIPKQFHFRKQARRSCFRVRKQVLVAAVIFSNAKSTVINYQLKFPTTPRLTILLLQSVKSSPQATRQTTCRTYKSQHANNKHGETVFFQCCKLPSNNPKSS